MNSQYIYGKVPILEALSARRRKIHRFFYLSQKKPEKILLDTLRLLNEQGIPSYPQQKDWFEKKFPHQVTQGWVAEADELPYLEYPSLLKKVSQQSHACLLVLDHIQDPHNLGAILRVAECFGVEGVILPEDRSAALSSTVSKVSAGAIEHLNIIQVTNLVRTMKDLKKIGFWVVGADAETKDSLQSFSWPDKLVLVLGSEGEGLSRLVKESCDFLVSIPMMGKVSSLNVSVATGIFLYDYQAKRKQ